MTNSNKPLPTQHIITRTVLEGLRAAGENWQASIVHHSFSREILAGGRPYLGESKCVSYKTAVENIQVSDKINLKDTYFVLDDECFFTAKGSTNGEFDDQVVIVHSFTLTPVQIKKPEGDDPKSISHG